MTTGGYYRHPFDPYFKKSEPIWLIEDITKGLIKCKNLRPKRLRGKCVAEEYKKYAAFKPSPPYSYKLEVPFSVLYTKAFHSQTPLKNK